MNLGIIFPLVIYLAFVFGAAIYAYVRRSKGDFLTEYYVGNRSMTGFVLAMTTASTYASASSFVGGPGAAYKFGLGWVLLAMIQVPAVWLALGALGKKFALLSRESNALTINDLLLYRYKNKYLVWISCIALLIAFFAAMTVQFIGGARLLETTIGISYTNALLIFAVTVGLYTFIGGFRAVVLTDTIQGTVMILGTIILLGATIYAAGGAESAVQKLNEIDPHLTSPYGPNDMLGFQFMASFWILVCFGVVGLPHTAVRCMAFKDSKALHNGMLIGTVVLSLVMLGMHLSGALGRAILPALDVPDQVIPTLMLQVLPPIVAGIFLAAPMSAIMSTIDAQLIQSSSIFVKDLYLSAKPEMAQNQKKISWFSSIITLILTALLILAALNPPKMIIWLNLFAFGGLEAAFLWVIVLGLYWEKANAVGAISSMVVGLASYVGLTAASIKLFDFHAIVPSLTFGLLAFLIGNKWGEKAKTQIH
ncbi:sodium/pantothenate symporter [Avibacterium paragallinarum]|uniref:Sodium/pantothenate symporter n=1 Tax=Avibacterium paragallinarum TaxID=728 RepID=A0A0F5ET90_AVIPA|nr:sodium/pantothenate symporter [Avibacterium paragallinarum]AZI15090.1 sodium/pantothenate symporter [Avibacterium paragallinarum]KAA6207965.1 sodium/pantothenate symporter [Avibacterium paragallinarum]KKB00624.1 sodium/panthothenate symporter [Avibacterium paragallinarum]QIR12523.1 sodium/pantothenate symporter [Avibacterium paragallinarum]QJE10522.1 sodium/pantothenate symporter [Avibacterium paragallinarum]